VGDKSAIEWTDATWNPTVGCTKVSAGCDHCYAERLVEGRMQHRYPDGFGQVRVHAHRVNLPLGWRRPRRVFVNSLSDLFHELIPDPWRVEIFAVMAAARRHTFQVLTKRPGPMASLLNRLSFRDAVRDRAMGKVLRDREWAWRWPLPNVWLGTSVENQKWADVRIPKLLDTPATVRFLSCEPLLGPVDLTALRASNGALIDCLRGDVKTGDGVVYAACPSGIDWVIVGGESGPGARPMDLAWARALVQQSRSANVAPFVKQLGAHPYDSGNGNLRWLCRSPKGGDPDEWPEDLRVRQFPLSTTAAARGAAS
jgi:protein gp37